MQNIFLYRGPNPPHGIGSKAEPAIRVEPLDGLHHADVAFADQLADRQAIAAVAHGDLGDEAKMRRDELVRGRLVLLVTPALGESKLLLRCQHREFTDFLKIAGKIALWGDIH